VARRRLEGARYARDHGPVWQLAEALAEDPAALAHLAHADDVAVEAVAECPHLATADRDVELELGIDPVRVVAAPVVGHARSAQVRPHEIEVDRFLRRDDRPFARPPGVTLFFQIRPT